MFIQIIILLICIVGYLLWKYILEPQNLYQNKNINKKPSSKVNDTQNLYQENYKQKSPRFIHSAKWKGSKKNYVFKKGSLGVGYYLDKKVSFEKVDVR